MWILVGGRTRVHRIEGGRQVRRRCEECEQVTLWAECNVRDRFELFFVPLFDTKSRRMVCMSCGEDLDPSEVPSARAPELAPPAGGRSMGGLDAAPPSKHPLAAAPPSSRRADPPPSKRLRPDDPEIDDMLAALKAKIGK